MYLDLRPRGLLPPEYVARLQDLAQCVGKTINASIDSVTVRLGGRRVWLYSGPASRSHLDSDLVYRCACLALVAELCQSGEPLDVLTDSRAFASTLMDWAAKKHVTISVRVVPPRVYFIGVFARILSVVGAALWQIWVLFAARLTGRNSTSVDLDLVLVDTFVLRDAQTPDPYFPGLYDCLGPEGKARVRFVPTVYGHGFGGFVTMFRAMRADCRYLLKEDHLRLTDYLVALCWPLGSIWLRVGPVDFLGFSLEEIIQEELRQCRSYSSMVTACLNEHFAKRLSQSGTQVVRTLSWFENQSVDKGWQAGFRSAYPGAQRVGYQGYVSQPLNLSLYLTPAELASGVAPDELAVMGPDLVSTARLYTPEMAVEVAPAFRFRYLTGEINWPQVRQRQVFVALPINVTDGLNILKVLAKAGEHHGFSDLSFLIKAHPAAPMHKLLAGLDVEIPPNWQMTDQPVSQLLPKCMMLVSTATSVCVEALAFGVPVALVATPGGLCLNPMPDTLRGGMWRMCITFEDLAQAIQHFYANQSALREEFNSAVAAFRNGCFMPVDCEGALALLGLCPD